jgi:hypothetical protein
MIIPGTGGGIERRELGAINRTRDYARDIGAEIMGRNKFGRTFTRLIAPARRATAPPGR